MSTYEGADFMGDRLRHVGSAVPRTSGLAEPGKKGVGKKTAAGKRDGVECCEWRNRIGCFICQRRTEETVTKEME